MKPKIKKMPIDYIRIFIVAFKLTKREDEAPGSFVVGFFAQELGNDKDL